MKAALSTSGAHGDPAVEVVNGTVEPRQALLWSTIYEVLADMLNHIFKRGYVLYIILNIFPDASAHTVSSVDSVITLVMYLRHQGYTEQRSTKFQSLYDVVRR